MAALLTLLIFSSPARAGSVQIPLHGVGAPAVDLLYQGQPIDRDEAVALQQQGVDLSTLDPASSDVWKPESFPAVDHEPWAYPENGAVVEFASEMPSSSSAEIFRSRVATTSRGAYAGPVAPGRNFQLIISLSGHAAMARAALLRRLGYPIPSPKHYSSLKVRFATPELREQFVDKLVYYTHKAEQTWITVQSEDGLELELQDVVLEPAQIDVPGYHWGAIRVDARVDNIQGRRALRALLVPFVFLDISRSINLYAWEVGRIVSERIVLTHPYAESFAEVTLADVQWMARRLEGLTREDYREILEAALYPTDVTALVLEKTIARRNHLLRLLQLRSNEIRFNSKISTGAVRRGKLTQATYEGHGDLFTYGNPESPLRIAEIGRFLLIEGISKGIGMLAQQLNRFLEVQAVPDLVEKHREDLLEEIQKHADENPGTPYIRPLGAWGGPIGSMGVMLSRNVMTGTYYGSESQVHMVDNLAVQGSIGYFMGIDGVPNVLPNVTGNLAVQRNYVHVRPVADMSSALKTDWKDLFVPSVMTELADELKEESDSEVGAEDDAAAGARLGAMLEKLKVGELLIVTDSLLANARLSAAIPLAPLLEFQTLGFGRASLRLGGGVQGAILKRTTFTKTEQGLQIYLQAIDSRGIDYNFDFNWWLTVASISQSRKWGEAVTRAYLFNQLPRDEGRLRRLEIAVHSLLKTNDSEILENSFPNFLLRHDVSSRMTRARFLRWNYTGVEEAHVLRIQPPLYEGQDYDPADFERTLIRHRIANTMGKNDYGFLSEIFQAARDLPMQLGYHPESFWAKLARYIPFLGFAADRSGSNPAHAFLGNGVWRSVSTEMEVTEGRQSNPVTVIERHWGGWSLSKKALLKLVDQINARVEPLSLGGEIIRPETFNTTESLKFYEIVQQLVLYQTGMEVVQRGLVHSRSVADAFNVLVFLNGHEDYYDWCRRMNRPVAIGQYPWEYRFDPNAYSVRDRDGERVDILCIKPWMKRVLRMRDDFPSKPGDQVRWTTRLMDVIDKNANPLRVLQWIQPENFFFEVKVRGFRTNDETAQDEDGMAAEYVSDSVGSRKLEDGLGVFTKLAQEYGIMAHELYARYLSEGF